MGSWITPLPSAMRIVSETRLRDLGNFNGLMGLLGVVISLGLAAFMKPHHRIVCSLVGGSLLVLSTFLLPLYLTAWAIVAFGLLRAIGGPLHGHALAPVALP